MGVPKQRHTKSRRNKGRMHLYIKQPVLGSCPKCAKPLTPHTLCKNCGYYNGRQVIDVFKKLDKKERKKKEKEVKEGEKAPKKELSMEELSKS